MAGSAQVRDTALGERATMPRGIGPLAGVGRFARRKPLGAAGAVIILLIALTAIFADQIAPRRFDKQDIVARLEPPSAKFVFGTDDLGRDVFSRLVYGARISLAVSFGAVALGLLHGSLWGIVSGYVGGATDLVVQRVMDGILSIPLLLMAMVIVAVLGASLPNVILAMGFVLTPSVNRVVRSAVLSVKSQPYIEAARTVGARPLRTVVYHVLPNVAPPLIVVSTINLGSAIITESSLSFLGMGVPPPFPTWGGMLSGTGRSFLQDAPWLAIFPGLVISITVLAFNLLGDAVRDVLDPRLRS
ncbi:MAG: ABC transporter permease [Dehalococcoidia bacterium]